MATYNDAVAAWSTPITTAGTETWQCRTGSIFLTVEASPAANDGIRLNAGDAVKIGTGKDVSYRLAGGSAALIAREVFE